MTGAAASAASTGRFRHEAFFYEGSDQFVSAMTAFLRDGMARDEPALVLLEADRNAELRSSLGSESDDVVFSDMRAVGRNPACLIPVWNAFARRYPGRALRGIGEPAWVGRSPDEFQECRQHEGLLNVAFKGSPMRLVCPYDARQLPREVLDEALLTHPLILAGEGSAPSPRFKERAGLDDPLSDPGEPVLELTVDLDALGELRQLILRHAQAGGLSRERADDLVIAINELVTNSFVHAGSASRLRCWTPPTSLVYEVHDCGHIEDPLAGRHTPRFALDGRGLWIVNHLCDLVQIRSTAEGTTVRVHMRR